MQQTHSSYIKGLSIAVIVLAGLSILGTLIGMLATGMISSFADASSPAYYEVSHGHGYVYSDYYSDTSEVLAILAAVVGFMGVIVLIGSAVVLVAGIIGLRGANDPSKLGQIFGWSIGGAIASFLTCGIIAMVLLIIIAVYANKDKNYYQAIQYGAQVPPAAGAPVAASPVPGAPIPGAAPIPPQHPIAAPTSAPQPGQPDPIQAPGQQPAPGPAPSQQTGPSAPNQH